VPGNEKADVLAGQEAGKVASSSMVSLTSLKLQISQRYNSAKEKWNGNPALHGKDSITPPPPKKSCLRWGQERRSLEVLDLKRIRKREEDRCWFCSKNGQKMTRSHVLAPLRQPKDRGGQTRGLGRSPPSGRANVVGEPRWEKRLLRFLELSGVGRTLENGADEEETRAERMDGWIVWEHRDREPD
jgi:hypothetical protein